VATLSDSSCCDDDLDKGGGGGEEVFQTITLQTSVPEVLAWDLSAVTSNILSDSSWFFLVLPED
jgi:hypothetical protein